MGISVEAIKNLREKTGAPIGDVKSALETCRGDEAKAIDYLKRKGFEAAKTRQGRAAKLGRVEAYVHHDGRVGALVEVNCETDFVARLPEFQQLCRDLGMQIASQQPETLQVLLEQPFIKDQGQTIGQYVSSLVAKTGENIVVKRFVRFGLGEAR
ncbi:MAG TPA: translation elongation factor Ts [Candidatus Omnitrophica bacterium]|nr:MAG: translation elongation factor Ts [Omnitrophica WOR_2 bacterium GWA2_63_20]OGX16169.1 MAG: translation elongation factor Ts [Omnitrophica WOR_2 bacterium GWF2_63_9]OGX32097.1 MAG: translation elongation factor Ts [Omnitrophica WOR_2 bacterium RIFCSPHIGHO2_12_FULL_64_13]OGX35147.1 MAG: translation elongation factor Ts [Omnitrophica WOR_2 bacterium RIFCSPHIGHO2_02_FULL_63_39]OGX45569.1 MAG: translation elongation factor Ts [Omnitrophica WOR_2 bacterium RIFCSPLOWO2_02_FULL_63_16]OGX48451.1